ncbi:hypothetical protein TELCIR_11702 [Teladorsagia circumcincta]|uniref:Major facilitator superfamily (MFS) profile domain-containing protein n=1 Tax=Teladorsagia circumcincta TaxID=45464 RepID=A0A2G9UA11_TELCI|nr:hypothetical protein TELCIR_11702 [Teladorsagia circumcincta]
MLHESSCNNLALQKKSELRVLARSLACGINSVNATVWIVECAPPAIRGRMAAMQEFFMAIGALITQALGVPFADDNLWPWIFLPNIGFVVASMIMFAFLHDSPQYIMQKTGDPDQARKALAAYHGVDADDSSLDAEIRICEEALTEEKAKKKADYGVIQTEHSSMAIMFMPWKARDPLSQIIRHGAWLGVMVKIATLVGLTTVLLISACGIGSLSRFYAAELVPRSILLESTSILTMFEALTKIGIEFAFYPLANVFAMGKNLR